MLTSIALAAFLSLQTADVATSCYAFRHGYVEGNPLAFTKDSCKVIAAESVALDVGFIALVQHKVKTPWKRALLYGLAAGVEAKAVYHNATYHKT